MTRTTLLSALLAFAVTGLAVLGGSALAADRGVLLRDGDRLTAEITPGDEDAFDLNLAEGGDVRLAVTAAAGSGLVPELRLYRPDGSAFDTALLMDRAGTAAPRLRRFRVPEGQTGRWQLRVAGASATRGAYTVVLHNKLPVAARARHVLLAAGQSFEVPFAGDTNARVRCSVQPARGATMSAAARVLDTDGDDVPLAPGAFQTARGLTAKSIVLSQGFGRYALAIDSDAAWDAQIDVTVNVTFARIRPRIETLPPEPTVTAVVPGEVRQETGGVALRLEGSALLAGSTAVLGGGGATVRSTAVASGGLGADLVADVAPDAPFGARSVIVFPPELLGESVAFDGLVTVRAPNPVVTSVNLAVGKQGDDGLVLEVGGTGFRAGGAIGVSGAGVAVGPATVVSANLARVTISVAEDAPFGPRDVTFMQPVAGGAASATLASAVTVRAPQPTIVGAVPNRLRQGEQGATVTLIGTGFRSGGTVTIGGSGLTLGASNVVSSTQATIAVDVAPDAAYGARDVTYTQPVAGGGDAATATGALVVLAPMPTIASTSPGAVRQEESSVTLTLTGTGYRTGGSISVSGAGLSVGATTVVSATQASVVVDVAANATFGARDVTFTQPVAGGGDSVTTSAALTVKAPVPTVTNASPAALHQEGSLVLVTLTGTGFRAGGTITLAGSGIGLGPTTVVDATTATVRATLAADAAYGARNATFTQPAAGGGDAATRSNAVAIHAPVPVVAGVSPATLHQGDSNVTLTVTGAGFRSGGAVSVSGTGLTLGATTIVDATTATVPVTIAANAAYGARNVTFTQAAAGGGDATTSTGAVTVNAPVPTLSGVAPGTLYQGDANVTFTVTGSGFRSGGAIAVSGPGLTLGATTVVDATTATVPVTLAADAAYGARDVTFTQPVAGGGDAASATGVVSVNAPQPTITSVVPSVLKQGQSGATLTVNGTNFRSGGAIAVAGTGLTLGSTTIVSDTQATIPVTVADTAAGGPRTVTYTHPAAGGGASASAVDAVSVNYPDPTISSVTPVIVGQTNSGTFTVNGTGFRAGFALTTGSGVTLSNLALVSPTQVTASYTVSGGATLAARDLTYTQNAIGGGASATKSNAYTVLPPEPTVTSTTPSVWFPGQGVTSVRVVGTGFVAGTTVAISGSGVTVANTSSGSPSTEMLLTVTVASNAALGARDIVITPGATGGPPHTFAGLVTIAPADPELTAFSHATLAQGSTSIAVTVTGQNFRAGDTLSASGTGVTFSATTLTGTTSLSATATLTAGAATGLRSLVVTHGAADGGRTGTLANAFRVIGATPTITSASPGLVGVTGSGGATREVPVSIAGTNFATGATVAISRTGGTGLSVVPNSTTVVSDTRIDLTILLAGSATTGLWNAVVTNPGALGNSGSTGNNVIDVKPAGTLTVNRVIASSGSTYGGERVTVQGSGFLDGCSVDFGAVRAAATQVLDANTLVTTVPVPAAASNSAATVVSVTVTNPAATGVTLAAAYAYAKDDLQFVTVTTVPAQGASTVPTNLKSAVVVLSAPFDTATGVYGASTGVNTFWFEQGGAFTASGARGVGPGGRFLVFTRFPLVPTLPIAGTGTYVLDIPTTLRSVGGNAFVPTRLGATSNHDQQTFTLQVGSLDTTVPTLSGVTPSNAATGQDPTTRIALTFSEAIDPITVTNSSVTLTQAATTVPATLSLSDDLRTVTITPQNELAASTTYTVGVATTLADLCGNGITAFTTTFTTSSGTDSVKPAIDAVVIESVPASLDGSGTYVNANGVGTSGYDLYMPRDGWSLDVAFSDGGGSGVDESTFSAKCSVAVGANSANAELASNFTVTSTGAFWRIPSTSRVTAGGNVTFTFQVRDRAGNVSTSRVIALDVADKDTIATNGGDHDPFDARRAWVLRTDLDVFTAAFSSTSTPSAKRGATTTVAANGVPDLDEALRLVGLNTAAMTPAAAVTSNGADLGTNAIVKRRFADRVRELLNERFDIAADGTRRAGSVDVEFLLPGEQGSLASLPAYSAANTATSVKAFSEISIGGTLGADSSAYAATATIGEAWYDDRNLHEEANLNLGAAGDTGIFLLGAFKLQVSSNALFMAKISNPLVAIHGGVPVGEDASDDDVLSGSFSRTGSANATFNARYDVIMDAIEYAALYTSTLLAHEIGHSLGLVADGAPKTGLFGAAHYTNTFTAATSLAPNTSKHLDYLGNDLMAGSTTFDATTSTGSAFKRFSPLDAAYLRNRLLYDEGK